MEMCITESLIVEMLLNARTEVLNPAHYLQGLHDLTGIGAMLRTLVQHAHHQTCQTRLVALGQWKHLQSIHRNMK